jgi:UDP-glucose 4-epimerase
MPAQTIAVTGSAGFIGSNLVDRLLADGHRVVGIDDCSTGRTANLSDAVLSDRFTQHTMDVRDPALVTVLERHRPQIVMHLAAQASVVLSMRDPAHDAGINVLGLLNVLEAAAAASVAKVIFASSGGTTYGEARDVPLREESRTGARPLSAYGISKKVAEDYLALYRRERQLDYTALALANVYGPRQDPAGEAGVVSIFCSKLLAGERPTIFGDGEQTRDYVFVDDVVDAFVRAGDPARASGLFLNVGTGREVTVNDIFRLLAEAASYPGHAWYGPARPGELRRNALDPAAAGRELGWEPRTALRDGLATTLEWVRRHADPFGAPAEASYAARATA